jgi:hypothetical protein
MKVEDFLDSQSEDEEKKETSRFKKQEYDGDDDIRVE